MSEVNQGSLGREAGRARTANGVQLRTMMKALTPACSRILMLAKSVTRNTHDTVE